MLTVFLYHLCGVCECVCLCDLCVCVRACMCVRELLTRNCFPVLMLTNFQTDRFLSAALSPALWLCYCLSFYSYIVCVCVCVCACACVCVHVCVPCVLLLQVCLCGGFVCLCVKKKRVKTKLSLVSRKLHNRKPCVNDTAILGARKQR